MKRLSLIMVIMFIGLSLFSSSAFAKYNLTPPQKKSIEINGKMYNFKLYKYDPPYLSPPYLLKDKSEQDLSTPEGTDIALSSAYGVDKEWYLSLFDKEARQEQLETDRETNGEYLKEIYKGKPLPDPIKEGNYDKFLYKIEFKHNNRMYTVIYADSFIFGEKEPGTYSPYVKEENKWLYTNDIQKHPLVDFVGLHSYDELQQLCKKGYWYTPGAEKPPKLQITLASNKKEYQYKEPIIFKVKIENIWREPVTICTAFKPLGKIIRFTIKSKQNKISDTDELITEKNITQEDFATLKPGEYKQITYKRTEYLKDVNPYYIPDKGIMEKDGTVYFPPGEYTVKVEYSPIGIDTSIAPENIAWPKGLAFISEPITIKVLPSEEYEAKLKEKEAKERQKKESRIKQPEPTPQPPTTEPTEENKEQPTQDKAKEDTNQVTLHLKDGRTIKGEIIYEDDKRIEIKTDMVKFRFDKDEIEKIERNNN